MDAFDFVNVIKRLYQPGSVSIVNIINQESNYKTFTERKKKSIAKMSDCVKGQSETPGMSSRYLRKIFFSFYISRLFFLLLTR